MSSQLKERFEIRWRNIVQRSSYFGLEPPSKEALFRKLEASYQRGFFCDYCGVKLEIKDSKKPYYRSFSIEHKKSLHFGGTNDLENLTIICHRCNITKGPMSEFTYREIIRYLPKSLFEKFCEESFAGKMASELGRQGLSKQ